MTTPVWITGFEYGLSTIVASGGGLADSVTGSPAISSSVKRTGGYSMNLNPSGAVKYIQKTLPSSDYQVGSVYIYFKDALPSGDCQLILGINTDANMYIYFESSDSKLYAGKIAVGSTAGPTVTYNTWYRIDYRFYTNATTHTIDWQVNGSAQTQYSVGSRTAVQLTAVRLSASNVTVDLYFDDVVISNTSADYPIGEHEVVGLRPNADGTHNAGTNVMEDGNGSDIDGLIIFAYQLVDDNPWSSTIDTDRIQQAANGTDNYVEVAFENTAETTIIGVQAVLQYAAAGSAANTGACTIENGPGGRVEVWGLGGALADYSETTATYKSAVVNNSSSWTMAYVNGLTCKMGYSDDADPDPYWMAVMLEVAYQGGPSASASSSKSASPSATPSPSPSSSASSSQSPSASVSASISASPSSSTSRSPSASPSSSPSRSPSASPSATPSSSPSSSPSASQSPSSSPSSSISRSPSSSISRSPSSSISRSPSASQSPSSSPSASPSPSPSTGVAGYNAWGYETRGIGVNVHLPQVRGGGFLGSITHLIQSYSHTINALGGFYSATITFAGDQSLIEEWYTDGLGRHIEVINPHGQTCWEGFVNSIEISFGALSTTRGPLIDIANRVSAMYTPIIEPDIEEPIIGTETETIIVEDTISQNRYGIWEKVISAGTVTDDEAEYVRNVFLEDSREPTVSTEISLGSGNGDAQITLHCAGYIEWLNYAYNDADDDYVTGSTKFGDVITAEPNSIYSTDQSQINTNGILTTSYEDGNRMARAIIEEIVSMGDINDNRWLYGCYEKRRIYYYAAPTTAEYSIHMAAPQQVVFLNTLTPVDPWDVRPGKWLNLLDFRTQGIIPSSIYENPSTVFIEQVSFTLPNQVQMSGQKIRRVEQLLARIGIGLG